MPFIPLPPSTELTLLVARLAGQLWWSSSSILLLLVKGEAACAAPKHGGLGHCVVGRLGHFFSPVHLWSSTVAVCLGISGDCKRRSSGDNLITGFPSATVH